jgi:hypothetical protein
MLGWKSLECGHAHGFRAPPSLSGKKVKRRLTVTLAWCFASDEMGKTDRSNKLRFRAEVHPCPRRLASDSPPRRRSPSFGSISSNTPPSRICATSTASNPTMFYRWQKEFFENGSAALELRSRRASDAKDRQIALLEQKLQRKHEVLSEIMEEHIKLRKELEEL